MWPPSSQTLLFLCSDSSVFWEEGRVRTWFLCVCLAVLVLLGCPRTWRSTYLCLLSGRIKGGRYTVQQIHLFLIISLP